jgi:anti-anti-sigma factor
VSRTVVLAVRVEGRPLRRLRGELLAHLRADPVLVVDAGGVQHLSDAGQAVLVAAHRAAVARGGRLHLHQPSPEVIAALRASGLQHLLQHTPARLEAAGPSQNRCASTGQPSRA